MLHYKVSGSGEPLVLIHGFLSDMNYWRPLLPELEQRFRVIRIELLGFGASHKPKTGYDITSQAQAVAETIRSITSDPAVLIAHSMGCLISSQVAADNPKLVKKLILTNPPIHKDPAQVISSLTATSLLYKVALYSPVSRAIWPIVKLISRFSSHKLFRYLTYSHTHASRQESLRLIEQTRLGPILEQVTCPTIVINGRYDRSEYTDNLELIPKRPNITVVQVDTGHHTTHQTPEILLDLI